MKQYTYPWTRFWCKRGENVLIDQDGFLIDPEQFNSGLNKELRTLGELHERPCLILIGESGIGKSRAMKEERERLLASADSTHCLDLENLSDTALYRQRGQEPLRLWFETACSAPLWIDGWDEASSRPVIRGLVDELTANEMPPATNPVRIACRTAAWLPQHTKQLQRKWREAEVWELLPLRRSDVLLAAQEREVDAEAFLRQVVDRQAGPLAARPITLELLFQVFEQAQVLPASRVEVYRKGLKWLVQEHNHHRPLAGTEGTLSPALRLQVAGRIAALTLLSQRNAIWTGRPPLRPPSNALDPMTVVGGVERAENEMVSVNLDHVNQVLCSGLFSDRDEGYIGWTHRTFAEMLAADYLVKASLPASMLLGKMTHPEDIEQLVAPQFYGLACWLVDLGGDDSEDEQRTRSSDVFELLLARQPEVLLDCDLQQRSEADRRQLVGALLDQSERGDHWRSFRDSWTRESRLNHSSLADQLRPYLLDKNRGVPVRHMALMLSRVCGVAELEDVFVSLALDTTEGTALRRTAAHNLEEVGSFTARSQMRPLLGLRHTEDPHDELCGAALCCLWPHQLGPDELFSHIHPPRAPGLIGSYRLFLHRVLFQRLASEMTSDFVRAAFRWCCGFLKEQSPSSEDAFYLELLKPVTELAWPLLENSDVFEAFIECADTIVKSRSELPGLPNEFASSSTENQTRRRRIIEALLRRHDGPRHRTPSMAVCRPQLIQCSDRDWLLELLQVEENIDVAHSICGLIRFTIRSDQLDDLMWMQGAVEQVDLLRDHFGTGWLSVELDSPEAEQMKLWHGPDVRLTARTDSDSAAAIVTRRAEGIMERLRECEENPKQYWLLERELTLNASGTHYVPGLCFPDLRSQDGWKTLNASLQHRLREVARRFLTAFAPSAKDWASPYHEPEVIVSGLHAFVLLVNEDPDAFDNLPGKVWSAWVAPLIRFAHFVGTDGTVFNPGKWPCDGQVIPVLRAAYERAPAQAMDAFETLFSDVSFSSKHVFFSATLHALWDDRIASWALDRVRQAGFPPHVNEDLLGYLLGEAHPGVLEWALEEVKRHIPPLSNEAWQHKLALGKSLLRNVTASAWPRLCPVIQANPEFGEALLRAWLSNARREELDVLYELSLTELEPFLSWLVTRFAFPGASTGQYSWDEIEQLRDGLLECVVGRATPDAVRVLERLQSLAPQSVALRLRVLEARKRMRKHGFPPCEPQALRRWLHVRAHEKAAERLAECVRRPEHVPIFISHAREDQGFLKRIKPALTQLGIAAFIDTEELRGGELWEAELRKEIDRAARVFVFWSRWSSNAPNVEKEWRYALERMAREGMEKDFIVPVRLDDTELPSSHPLAKFEFFRIMNGEFIRETPVPSTGTVDACP